MAHTVPLADAPPRRRPWWGKLLWLALLALGLGAGWVLASGRWRQDTREALPDDALADRDPGTVLVTVAPVMYRPVQRTVLAVGTLHGFEEVALSAKVEGRVRQIHHDVADRVKPGELLLELDATDYQLAAQQAERALQVELAKLGLKEPPVGDFDPAQVPTVMQAQVRLDNMKNRQQRARRMASSRAASIEELDNIAGDLQAAQAEHADRVLQARAGLATIRMKQTALAIARQQLADARVQAPVPTLPVPGAADGALYAITSRSAAEGTLVRPGTEVYKLVITQTLKLRVPVPERFSPEVRLGQKADVTTSAFARPFAGTVTRINPAVDPATRTFEVEIQVPNPRGELKPGGFARAAIFTRLDATAATVPLAAVANFAGIDKVFLATGTRAKEVRVTLGAQTPEWVEITAPALPRGAQVITSGQTVLADETPIAVRATASRASVAGAESSKPR